MMSIRSAALLVLPLATVVATSGCSSSKKHTAAAPQVLPSHRSVTGGPAGANGTAKSGGVTGGAKTCPTADVRATINGATKCLVAGQQCSAKAIAQYPRYHFVCRPKGSSYVLARS